MIKIVIPLILSSGANRLAFDGFVCARLNALLSKADISGDCAVSLATGLFAEFGIYQAETELPLAAVSYCGEYKQKAEGYWLRVDPVHLQADLHDSILYHPQQLDLVKSEADALFASLQQHFSEYRFAQGADSRWYLNTEQAMPLKTYGVDRLAGQYINAYLPQAKHVKDIMKFLNEVQMLLHDHPINRLREERGVLPVNSVWVYGEGECPQQLKTNITDVYSDECLASGLAFLAGVESKPLSEFNLRNLLKSGCLDSRRNILVVKRYLYDVQLQSNDVLLAQIFSQLEEDWFNHLLAALKRRKLDCLEIDFCTGLKFVITPNKLKRFWRRVKPFTQRL